MKMAAAVRQATAGDKARAHEEDVATLLDILEAKSKEISALKAALRRSESFVETLRTQVATLDKIKAICGPA